MNYPFRSCFLAILIFFAVLQIIGSMQSLNFLQSSKNSSSIAIFSSNNNLSNFSQNLQKNSVISEIKIADHPDSAAPKLLIKKQSLPERKNDHLADNSESKNAIDSVANWGEKIGKVISNPLPEIPEDMRYEAFSTKIVARFFVGKNGEVLKVDLISAASNPRLNSLLVKSLKKWRFEASNTEFSEEIKVNFRVE